MDAGVAVESELSSREDEYVLAGDWGIGGGRGGGGWGGGRRIWVVILSWMGDVDGMGWDRAMVFFW